MNRIAIGPEGRFSFGGENFVITVPVKEPRLSTLEAFTIAKNEPYLRVYEDLASAFRHDQFLNLGFFREAVTCCWTNYLSRGECRLWTLVENL